MKRLIYSVKRQKQREHVIFLDLLVYSFIISVEHMKLVLWQRSHKLDKVLISLTSNTK